MASAKPNKKASVGKDVQFSKTMTYLLRHGAIKEGLNISQDGFVKLDDLLDQEHPTDNSLLHDELVTMGTYPSLVAVSVR